MAKKDDGVYDIVAIDDRPGPVTRSRSLPRIQDITPDIAKPLVKMIRRGRKPSRTAPDPPSPRRSPRRKPKKDSESRPTTPTSILKSAPSSPPPRPLEDKSGPEKQPPSNPFLVDSPTPSAPPVENFPVVEAQPRTMEVYKPPERGSSPSSVRTAPRVDQTLPLKARVETHEGPKTYLPGLTNLNNTFSYAIPRAVDRQMDEDDYERLDDRLRKNLRPQARDRAAQELEFLAKQALYGIDSHHDLLSGQQKVRFVESLDPPKIDAQRALYNRFKTVRPFEKINHNLYQFLKDLAEFSNAKKFTKEDIHIFVLSYLQGNLRRTYEQLVKVRGVLGALEEIANMYVDDYVEFDFEGLHAMRIRPGHVREDMANLRSKIMQIYPHLKESEIDERVFEATVTKVDSGTRSIIQAQQRRIKATHKKLGIGFATMEYMYLVQQVQRNYDKKGTLEANVNFAEACAPEPTGPMPYGDSSDEDTNDYSKVESLVHSMDTKLTQSISNLQASIAKLQAEQKRGSDVKVRQTNTNNASRQANDEGREFYTANSPEARKIGIQLTKNYAVSSPRERTVIDRYEKIQKQYSKKFPLKEPSYDKNAAILPYELKNDKQVLRTPFEGKLFTTTDKYKEGSFSKDYVQWAKDHCYKCGSDFCAARDPRCLYAQCPDVWIPCSNCRAGLLHGEKFCKTLKVRN